MGSIPTDSIAVNNVVMRVRNKTLRAFNVEHQHQVATWALEEIKQWEPVPYEYPPEFNLSGRIKLMGKYASTSAVPQGHTFGDPFKFKKLGKDIAEKANAKIVKLQQDMEKARTNSAELCKKYGVELDEAVTEEEKLGEVDDESEMAVDAVRNSYSNKVLERGGMKAKDIQADINKIQQAAREIIYFKQQINTFKMLAAHIEPTREFDLHFSQLVQLGF